MYGCPAANAAVKIDLTTQHLHLFDDGAETHRFALASGGHRCSHVEAASVIFDLSGETVGTKIQADLHMGGVGVFASGICLGRRDVGRVAGVVCECGCREVERDWKEGPSVRQTLGSSAALA